MLSFDMQTSTTDLQSSPAVVKKKKTASRRSAAVTERGPGSTDTPSGAAAKLGTIGKGLSAKKQSTTSIQVNYCCLDDKVVSLLLFCAVLML